MVVFLSLFPVFYLIAMQFASDPKRTESLRCRRNAGRRRHHVLEAILPVMLLDDEKAV